MKINRENRMSQKGTAERRKVNILNLGFSSKNTELNNVKQLIMLPVLIQTNLPRLR